MPEYNSRPDLTRLWKDLVARIEKLERANPLTNASAGLGSAQLSVIDGVITIFNEDGIPVIRIGESILSILTTGNLVEVLRLGLQQWGDIGFSLVRESGIRAITMKKSFDNSTDQDLTLYARSGAAILQDGLFRNGIEWPLFEMPMQPIAAATGSAVTCGPFGFERSTTSGSFVDIFRWEGVRQNCYYRPVFNIKMSDTTTSGEVQCIDGTTAGVLGGFFQPPWTGVIAVGSSADQELIPPYGLNCPGDALDSTTDIIKVQARRTAGAGTMTVSLKQSHGGWA